MAKSERTVNPATAHLKAQKNKAVKKNKAAITAQRQERLANQNPNRLQRQIDDLQSAKEARGGQLRDQDQKQLDKLNRDLKLIQKARDKTSGPAKKDDGGKGGDKGGSNLGKRRRDDTQRGGGQHKRMRDDAHSEDEEDTDPEVRNIPMPRDESPPVPRRRSRRLRGEAPNGDEAEQSQPLPAKSEPVPVKTSYSAAPQLRNLQKEATSAFVPAAVAARQKQLKGEGGKYLEPEEVDKLEQESKEAAERVADAAAKEEAYSELAVEGNEKGMTIEEEDAFWKRAAAEASELERGIEHDARMAAEEAAKEEEHAILAGLQVDKDDLRQEALKDAEAAANAAEIEAKHRIAADQPSSTGGGVLGAAYADSSDEEEQNTKPPVEEEQDLKPVKQLRYVEIESVEDEGD